MASTVTCSDATGPNGVPPGETVSVINVSPVHDSLVLGDTVRLIATVLSTRGDTIKTAVVNWTVSDTSKASVTAAGLVSDRAPGSFVVYSTVGTVTGGAFFNGKFPAAGVALPDSVVMREYHPVAVIGLVVSAAGTPVAGHVIHWSTPDTALLSVDSLGNLTAHGVGRAHLRATSGAFADSMIVRIDPEQVTGLYIYPPDATVYVGVPVTLTSVAGDIAGRAVPGATVGWISRDTTVARVVADSAATSVGIVTNVGRGVTWIVATSGPATDSVFLSVDRLITDWRFDPDTIILAAGSWQLPIAIGRDTLGVAHAYGPVSPVIPLDTAILSFDTRGVFGLKPGVARITGMVYGEYPMHDTAVVIVRNAGLERITWGTPPYPGNINNYTSFAIPVSITDSNGTALAPRTVVITSSDTSVLYLADTLYSNFVHDTTIHVQARRFGPARLTARTDSALGVTGLSVTEVRPYRVTIAPDSLFIPIGDTTATSHVVEGTDANYYPYALTWHSSNIAVATVDTGGTIVGVGGGIAVITATAGKVTGTVTVVVRSAGAPVITSVTPAELVAGGIATLHGNGFTATPSADTIGVEGISTIATAATDSTITFQLPAGSAFTCDSTHNTELVVSSGGRYVSTITPFTPATTVSIGAGTNGPVTLTLDQARCVEVNQTTGRDFVVTVTNTGSDPTQTVAVQAGQTVLPHAAPPRSPTPTGGAVPVSLSGTGFPTARSGGHLPLLQSNRTLLRQLGSPIPGLVQRRMSRPALSAGAQVNGIAEFRIPRVDEAAYCTEYTDVGARLAYEGQHIRIFEDTAAPLRGLTDAAYAAIGSQFDSVMWGVLSNNFGNPLALDSLLDRSGKVSLLLSPVVNAYGAAAFTVPCDFFSETQEPASNTGEVIYGEVPTAPGTGYSTFTGQAWQWSFPEVLMHEAKHLTAYAERISRGEGPEDVWLEEGTADAAVEIWARGLYGLSWKGDGMYANTLYCDVRPTFPACNGRPFAMFENFEELFDFALNHDSASALGPTTPTDGVFLGGAWFLLRWTIDRYAGSESALLRQLTVSAATGVTNLQNVSGHPLSQILPNAMLALRMSPSSQAGAPAFPSWNLPSVFTGMAADFPGTFFTTQPVAVHGDGDPVPPLPGGGFVIFDQGQGLLNTLVRVSGPHGLTLPGYISVQLVSLP